MKFNLDVLSPMEFEKLARDIISKKLDLEFKNYKSGKDGGIDLRNKENGIICQCKHIKKITDLKSNIKKELPKIDKIKELKKYYLIVSTQLTPQNENEIIKILDKYIEDSNQIISYNEIEFFLEQEKNIDVLKNNSKLWLTSYRVLEIFQQKYIDFEINNLLDNIKSNMSYFVETNVFRKCYDKILNDRLLIISGAPGVGKTINSNMLVAKMIANNPDLKLKTTNGSNYKEMIKTLDYDSFEIIILDDFLGQSYLDKTSEQISEIIKIIDYVKRNSNKYLILNSRLNVLNDAKMTHEKFEELLNSLEGNKYVIDMENITYLEKAEIIYNLHYFNKVPKEYFEELKKKNLFWYRYEEIVKNANYNTRIIEYCVINYKKDNISKEKYYEYIMKNIKNPRQVWHRQFSKFSNEELSYLHTMYSLGTNDVSNVRLKECFENVSRKRNYDTEQNKYNKITEKMSNCIIKQSVKGTEFVLNVINPSVNDYIMNELKENNLELEKMLEECVYIEQLINLVNINPKIIEKISFNILKLKSAINNLDRELLYLIEKYEYFNEEVKKYLHNIILECKEVNCVSILRILSNEKIIEKYNLYDYIFDVKLLKKLFKNSTSYEIKNYIFFMDKYIEDKEGRRIDEFLNDMYLELTEIISLKIEEDVFRDVIDEIGSIVFSNIEKVMYRIEDEEYIIENYEEIKKIVISELDIIIDSLIEKEVESYMLNDIEFKNIDIDKNNCIDTSCIKQFIEQELYDEINEQKSLEEKKEITIDDIFNQEYDI